MKSKLAVLIGEKVVKIDSGLSSVNPIDSKEKFEELSSMMVSRIINFENYILHIYNNHEIISPQDQNLSSIVGQTVISIIETDEKVDIILFKNDIIRVNLEDSAYNDPEAMCLYGPDNYCIVWN